MLLCVKIGKPATAYAGAAVRSQDSVCVAPLTAALTSTGKGTISQFDIACESSVHNNTPAA